jgi:hypothetical protein
VKNAGLGLFGWLVPGGTYLLTRRYLQFAGFAILISLAVGAGLAMQGATEWPQSGELQGLDGFTSLLFQAGALARWLAGGPLLAAELLGVSHSFLNGCVHEFGTALLSLAGVLNVLAIANALESRKDAS